jgi:hypothetical protein
VAHDVEHVIETLENLRLDAQSWRELEPLTDTLDRHVGPIRKTAVK